MTVLVTGGTGYIGSHVVVELLNRDFQVVSIDNFSNSSPKVNERIKKITGKDYRFYEADARDRATLAKVFSENKIDCVIHFAALKAVGESVEKPLEYYDNNMNALLSLCFVMKDSGCKKLIFSSSATVYGLPERVPIDEECRLSVTNPYGRSKLMAEEILKDLYLADPEFSISLLRYFNPIGAHKSGLIGESPSGVPNNLLPYVSQVAVGKLAELKIFGDDYDTVDGTGVRDYIHVVDLALGHIKAIEKVMSGTGVSVYNLGTGIGYSVLEIVKAFERVTGRKVPYKIVARRPGDIATCYSDPAKAKKELGWEALYNLDDMCRDLWHWQTTNPNGFND